MTWPTDDWIGTSSPLDLSLGGDLSGKHYVLYQEAFGGMRRAGRRLNRRMKRAVDRDATPSAEGCIEDLARGGYGMHIVAFEAVQENPEDLFVAGAACSFILAVWPLVEGQGLPLHGRPRNHVVRRAWLYTLPSDLQAEILAAEAAEPFIEEDHSDEWPWRSVIAIAHDARRTGRTLRRLGDERGTVAIEAGDAFLAHLTAFEGVRARWGEIEEKRREQLEEAERQERLAARPRCR